MLHYLLSLPDDWEVNQAQCAKFWNIGRDKCRRIFRSLRRTGWAQLERLQSDDGAFIGVRWIIGDEPGIETTDEALAVEEVGDERSDADAAADHATPKPSDGQPVGRVSHATEKASHERIKTLEEDRDSTNTTASAARDDLDDGTPPPPFGEVLRLWPADNIASAWACEKIYAPCSAKQKCAARDGIRPYLAECRSKGQTRLCDLKTYLNERRWEKFTKGGLRAGASLHVIRRGTPQASRWRAHYERFEPAKLPVFDQLMMSSGQYTVLSEWPPPQSMLSEADSREVANL